MGPDQVDFDSFRTEWLKSVRENNPSTVDLGRRFSHKLLTQWLDLGDGSEDPVYCDGAGDGGIDIAYLQRAESADADGDTTSGDRWYLIQSKYGSAFAGTNTLLAESQKLIDTLDGRRPRLSSLAQGLLERLNEFRNNASERDRIVLVFATEEPLTRRGRN